MVLRTVLVLLSLASLAAVVIMAKLCGDIRVPGYTPIVLASLFFGALTSLGFGIVGQYLWPALQSSHRRPAYIIRDAEEHGRSKTRRRRTIVPDSQSY